MNKEELLTKLKGIEAIVNSNHTVIGKDAEYLADDCGIEESSKIQDAMKDTEYKGRLLKIGIIGRVKAGKSSLLNSLIFEGKDILPKAATPMTANLTVLSYGERNAAEIEYFSSEDREDIKKKHDIYEKRMNDLIEQYQQEHKEKQKEEPADKERIERRAKRELKGSIEEASYDQYKRMQKSGVDPTRLEEKTTLESNTMKELANELIDYVSAEGTYMPFTRSIRVALPNEFLKDIEIVDTPGLNDPVVSREERTRELLRYCDVIFIVSPSGQFMTEQDIELLQRISTKEGLRELYVVASQVDTQLFGSEKKATVIDAIDGLSNILATRLQEVISKLKEHSPEVGDKLNKLIEDNRERIICCSGIAQSILLRMYDSGTITDEGQTTVWNNLKHHYPNNFSDGDKTTSEESLKVLANITKVEEKIRYVRSQKDKIFEDKQKDYIHTKSQALSSYQQALLDAVEKKIQELQEADIDELKKKKEKLQKIKSTGEGQLSDTFNSSVRDLYVCMKKKLSDGIEVLFGDTSKRVGDAEGSVTETYTTGWWLWKKDHHRDVTTVRAGDIRDKLETITSKIKLKIEDIANEKIKAWKSKIRKDILYSIRDVVDDKYLNDLTIKSSFHVIFSKIVDPNISFEDNSLNSTLQQSEILKGYEAKEYMKEASNYINTFKSSVIKRIEQYTEQLKNTLSKYEIGTEIFANIDETITAFEKDIENKKAILAQYDTIEKNLKEL